MTTSAAASVATYRPLQALNRTRGTGPTGRGFGDAGEEGHDVDREGRNGNVGNVGVGSAGESKPSTVLGIPITSNPGDAANRASAHRTVHRLWARANRPYVVPSPRLPRDRTCRPPTG